jgi:hypothetical protein
MNDEINESILTPAASAPQGGAHPRGTQLSLLELFFVMTAVAVEVGVYLHVSQLLAYLAGGCVLLIGAIRLGDIHNNLLGSMVGYCVAMLVGWLYVLTCHASLEVAVTTLIFFPACGYLLGGLLAESHDLHD